jgi:hypothetical protein
VSLDPAELGWNEFWLRIGAIFFLLLGALTMFLIAGKVALLVYDLGRWIVKKFNGKGEEEEMSPANLHRTLLRLVPSPQRNQAEKLLKRLLTACGGSGEMFVAEYDGKPATVHRSPEGAFRACARHLNDEPGPDVPWDWFEDEFGWVMRRIDMDTMKPVSLLGGKVTRTEVGE